MPAKRFIAFGARAGNGHGYLNRPERPCPEVADDPEVVARIRAATQTCDEPENIGPDIVNAQTELARTYDRIRYMAQLSEAQQTRRLLTIEARMADVQRRAKLRGANVSGEMHVVKKMLERARAGGRKDPPAAIERIERIEYRLDWRPDLEDAA